MIRLYIYVTSRETFSINRERRHIERNFGINRLPSDSWSDKEEEIKLTVSMAFSRRKISS